MANYSNGTKQSAASFSNDSRSSASNKNQVKPGKAGAYDNDAMGYDDVVDPISGNAVTYDTIGTEPTYSNQAKS